MKYHGILKKTYWCEAIMLNEIILFVKFGEEQYIKKLLNGTLHFSNANCFCRMERENGQKGQGDAFEAVFQLKIKAGYFIDNSTLKKRNYSEERINVVFPNVLNTPVFCITGIKRGDCTISESGEKRILKIDEEIKKTIKSHFPKADSAGVFFQPIDFINSFKQLGMFVHDDIHYYNFNIDGILENMIKYVSQCPGKINGRTSYLMKMDCKMDNNEQNTMYITTQNMHRILFCKDNYFSKEKEYRIILPQKSILKPKDYYIGWGSQKRQIYKMDEFFEGIEI